MMIAAKYATRSLGATLLGRDVQEVVEPPVGFGSPDGHQQLFELHVEVRSRFWPVDFEAYGIHFARSDVTDRPEVTCRVSMGGF